MLSESLNASEDLYRLTDEQLGEGTYAKVHGCVNLHSGKEYAVKVRRVLHCVSADGGRCSRKFSYIGVRSCDKIGVVIC